MRLDFYLVFFFSLQIILQLYILFFPSDLRS